MFIAVPPLCYEITQDQTGKSRSESQKTGKTTLRQEISSREGRSGTYVICNMFKTFFFPQSSGLGFGPPLKSGKKCHPRPRTAGG